MTISERLYRWLLRLYPRRFRAEYGTDAVELFVDRLDEARARGRLGVAGLWVRTLPNVLVNGTLERCASVARGMREADLAATPRLAVRGLARSPRLAAWIVVTLGVGIGANVALFGVLREVLLRPLPYPEADRLVQLWETNPDVDGERHGPSPLNFADWEASAEGFESMAAWYLTSGTYRTDSWVEEIRSAQVTADFFRTMGVEPMVGRDFLTDEVERDGPLMLSHRLWQRRFGGDPSVVGRTIVSSASTYRVVGVMPPGFSFPDGGVEAWVAWNLPTVYAGRPESRTWRFLRGVGRLGSGVSMEAGEEALDRVAAALADRYPGMNGGWDATVTSLHEDVVGDVRGTLWVAFGSVLFILLIACANVANLLLARVPARSRAVAIRATLGASRARIARELLLEHLVLGALAGVLGLALGRLFIDALVELDAGRTPRLSEVPIDLGLFGFTAAVALATTLAFGIAPLLQLLARSEAASVVGGARATASASQRRLRDAFVGSQVAVALVLLTGGTLFSASLLRLSRVDAGFEPERVASFRVSLDPVDGSAEAIVSYYEGLVARIEDVPGVASAGAVQTLPLDAVGNDFQRPYRPTGSGIASADASAVQMRIVTPGYVETMGMTVVAGSSLPEEPGLGEPLIALVNRTLAGRLRPGGNAVGETFDIDFREGWESYRIVGVVEDVRHYGPRVEAVPEVFLSHRQVPYLAMTVVAKTAVEPRELEPDLRSAVLSHMPMQPPHNFVSLEELLSAATAGERFLSVLLSLFGGIGLLLASTGVYGVIAYSVGHRRREIGVRVALGADPRGVVGSVFREAAAVAGAGLVTGLGVVLLLSALVESVLYEVAPRDPASIVAACLAMGAVVAVAAWIPARRAARIAPAEALRTE